MYKSFAGEGILFVRLIGACLRMGCLCILPPHLFMFLCLSIQKLSLVQKRPHLPSANFIPLAPFIDAICIFKQKKGGGEGTLQSEHLNSFNE